MTKTASPYIRALVAIPCLTTLLMTGCDTNVSQEPEAALAAAQYEANIVRTAYGIPHITAGDWGSLGFGEAYASAQDHVCNMALALLESRGESALALGPGDDNKNLARDIVIKALDINGKAATALAQQTPEIKDWIVGYAAGYNHYLAEKSNGVGSWCNGADWVRPVAPEEFMAQYLVLVQTLPRVAPALVGARLPSSVVEESIASTTGGLSTGINEPSVIDILDGLALSDMGSNAWALAGARTENGKGLLLANPHYPWYGTARFWEKHLTIPGEYDAYGVGLIGTPGVALGFNQHLGWSHTVSDSKRTVIYQLTLNPQNPKEYRWEDGWRELSATQVSVAVAHEQGTQTVEHTVWSSHHGPLIALPGMTDDPYTVFAVRDANADNTHTLSQWQAMGQADGMDAFIKAHERHNAMPWINTIAASADGRAVYIDNSTVGALTDAAMSTWQQQIDNNPKLKYLYLTQGLVILDGSRADNDWRNTDAPIPNTEPFQRRPLIESEQYVFNANDSYWLSDPSNPAKALSPLYGATQSPRSVRTRMNVELLRSDSPFGYAGDDGRFSIQEVQRALFANDSLSAHLLLSELLSACNTSDAIELNGNRVDLASACAVLASWDRSFNLDAKGAVLFREWITRYAYNDTYINGELFEVSFDPSAPLTTPHGLANPQKALQKLAEATQVLASANLALDVALGEVQAGHRAGTRIALHGGNRYEGIANLQVAANPARRPADVPTYTGSSEMISDSRQLTSSGYNIVHGSSFIMTLGFNDEGPEAAAILSYSQSGDPASAHFTDQTELYRDKRWRKILFRPEDVAANAVSTQRVMSAR